MRWAHSHWLYFLRGLFIRTETAQLVSSGTLRSWRRIQRKVNGSILS
jgi:hypothetical protein